MLNFNLEKQTINNCRLFPEFPKITCINYGPYDNGYLLLGMDNGTLISMEYMSFEIFDRKTVFIGSTKITRIDYEPTKYLFIGNDLGQLSVLTFIE